MTKNKEFKRRIRERMSKTGERYTTARTHLLIDRTGAEPGDRFDPRGIHPATTAFRILLEQAGASLPEEQLLIAGGGVGIGVFSFYYEEFSSLFFAGRHLWHDDLAFLHGLAQRLGVELEVRETGGRKRAERDLQESLEAGPVAAFVDLGTLDYRGGVEAYYLVVVKEIDEKRGLALIGDLTDRPVEIPLTTLADARARHGKFKNRLVQVKPVSGALPMADGLRAGMQACGDGLENSPMKGYGTNFTLDSLEQLAARMRGTGKDSWARVFPPGVRLWSALSSLYEYVEHYGTGGGLLRPFFGHSLREAGGPAGLDTAGPAAAYARLGERWTSMARTALDPQIPAFAELAEVIDEIYATYDELGPDSQSELTELRRKREALTSSPFPLGEGEARAHVERLADAVEELATGEREALTLLRALPL